MDIAAYTATETLRDGRALLIRAQRREDTDGLLQAVGRVSPQSRRYRFFAPKNAFSDAEIAHFSDVDFVTHVALVAVVDEDGAARIVGGGRYFVSQPGHAEVAFMVDDAHHGLGIASALLRHLVVIARAAGLEELHADVLRENTAMLEVLRKCASAVTRSGDPGVTHVSIPLA